MVENASESETKAAAVTQGVGSVTSRVRNFIADVVTEVRKTSWPNRQELVESTWVVIVMVVALGFYIAACDWVLIKVLGWLSR